jgi:hypothetical protein
MYSTLEFVLEVFLASYANDIGHTHQLLHMRAVLNASKEPFWDLEISKYLTVVSIKYFISCVFPSLTSTAGQTSRILLTFVIPWINKASFAL